MFIFIEHVSNTDSCVHLQSSGDNIVTSLVLMSLFELPPPYVLSVCWYTCNTPNSYRLFDYFPLEPFLSLNVLFKSAMINNGSWKSWLLGYPTRRVTDFIQTLSCLPGVFDVYDKMYSLRFPIKYATRPSPFYCHSHMGSSI